MSQSKSTLLPKIYLFGAALIWGSSFFILKGSLDTLDVHFVLGIRFLGSAILLSLVFLKRWKNFDFRTMWSGLLLGVCYYVAFELQSNGLIETTPGKNAFLTAVYCVIVPFLAWFFHQGKPKPRHLIAGVILLLGIALISFTPGDLTLSTGDALTISSGFFYALHVVLVARYSKRSDPFLLLIFQFWGSAILCWGTAFATGSPLGFTSVVDLLSVLYLTVFCSALALLFQFAGQYRVEPNVAAIILSLESVFGLIFSMIFYGERPTLRMMVGFAVVFFAVILSQLNEKEPVQEGTLEESATE